MRLACVVLSPYAASLPEGQLPVYLAAVARAGALLADALADQAELAHTHGPRAVAEAAYRPGGPSVERYWDDAPYPELVKTVPHVAFEVDDLEAALEGHRVIIEPNSPSRGVIVAFMEVGGAPVELMQIDHEVRPDL